MHNGKPAESFDNTINTALAAVRDQQSKLQALLGEVGEASVAEVAEQRRLAVDRVAIIARIEQLETEVAKQRTSELAEELVSLRERQHALRQHEQRLAGRVDQLSAIGQRLQRAIQESEAVAALLASEAPARQRRLPGNMPWQVAQAQEEERERLAREIHDGPAQALANAIFELEFCERLMDKDPPKLRKEILRLKDDLRQSLGDVRHFIFGLRPAVLNDLGLVAALRRFVDGYQTRCGIPVTLEFDEQPRLTPNQEVTMFRIVQEALQNARKHSKACKVLVRLRTLPERFEITIEDDGEGFDPAAVAEKSIGHFGLTGMYERARLIGGQLEVRSKPGAGTTISLSVPREAPDDVSGI